MSRERGSCEWTNRRCRQEPEIEIFLSAADYFAAGGATHRVASRFSVRKPSVNPLARKMGKRPWERVMVRPTIICPVDVSEPSRAALRFAGAIAEHFYAGLTVVTVVDPPLSGAAGTADAEGTSEKQTGLELERFITDTFRRRMPNLAELQRVVAIGRPALEILRIASHQDADLIVMSTHGHTGLGKAFFGSTTEQLLRKTDVPVLVTPAGDPGPIDLEDLTRGFGGVLAPVDFSPFTPRQLAVAHGLACALATTLTVLHVVEPPIVVPERERVARLAQAERKRRAAQELTGLVAALRIDPPPARVVAEGDPAVEIVRTAAAAGSGAIVMGLHDATGLGPHMGSMTYRVLCQTQSPVLALPPTADAAERKPAVFARTSHRLHDRPVTVSLPEGR